MIRIPSHGKPPVPPPVTPKEVAKEAEAKREARAPQKVPAPPAGVDRGPEQLDARGIAVRLAALATEAKKKEIAVSEFERILEEVIKLTGLSEPQAAMEEANRQLQKEIEAELERIKSNKELMEEAEDWQRFADLLERMGPETAGAMLDMMKDAVRELV